MITGNVINTLLFIFHCTFKSGCVDRKMRISAILNFQIAANDKIISFYPFFFKLSVYCCHVVLQREIELFF